MGLSAIETLAASRSYTDLSVEGAGAIKGKNCVVSSAVIEGGHRVTVGWYRDSDDAYQEFYFDVMDGEDGPQGPQGIQGVTGTGIDSVSVDENNNLTVTYDDGTSELAGQIQLNGDQGYIPCGTRLGYYGTTAPLGFLLCDGTEYLKSDYPELAELLGATDSAQGTTVFAGSDSDHFKVPDLRGEFIRGAGTNSHTNSVLGTTEGSGSNVGVHQQATSHRYYQVEFAKGVFGFTNNAGNAGDYDGQKVSGKMKYSTTFTNQTPDPPTGSNYPCYFTARPTNTSENMIIAYKDIYLSPRHEYSTDEQVVGKWIDGKPVYEKTFKDVVVPSYSSGNPVSTIVDISGLHYDTVVNYTGQMYETSAWNMLPVYSGANFTSIMISSNNLYLYNSISGHNSRKVNITIQYTKTTD